MANPYNNIRVRRIIRRFGLIPLRSRSVASVYRKHAVVRVRTEHGTYAMKPFFRSSLLRSSTIDQIKTTATCIQLLMNNGFQYMPRWLTGHSGKLWTLHQGRPFYITPWIQGRKLENREDFEKLGLALASLHTTSSGILPEPTPFYDHIRFWQTQDKRFRTRMAKAKHINKRTIRWYRRFGETCNRLSDRSWTELKSPEAVSLLEKETIRPALIHSDITLPNVIISDDGQLFIIDWDSVKLGSAYVEVATALANTTGFHPDYMHSLLNGYEQRRPLDRNERQLIASLFRFPREAWYATRFPNRPRSRSMLTITEQTWVPRLKAVEMVEIWANQ